MAFNWFQRKFEESTPLETQQETAPKELPEELPEKPQETIQEDLLAWAKTAYTKLQQKEPVLPIPESAPEATKEIEIDRQPEIIPTTAPLPAWMQIDRSARLAELSASALPAPPTPPVPQKLDRKSLLAFDAEFLWSAQVLAQQGRKAEDISAEEITWLNRLRQGLGKTRLNFVNQLKSLVGLGPLGTEAIEEIENLLLQADVGVTATEKIINALQNKLRQEVLPPEAGIAYLKQLLKDILDTPLVDRPPQLIPVKNQLNIWLITGVNGAGKTTTIGKLAKLAVKSGYSTLIAGADTFRAAAVEQVRTWGDRSGVEVIANPSANADPAAVVFDAITSAQAKGTELLLVDTAGRLQNKKNLMEELSKIRKIIDKKAQGSIVESLLVLDATLGQNGLSQAQIFSQSAGVGGIILTKLDGTARGGVAIAVVQQLNLPIRFLGAGEGIDDLRPFSSYEFVEALLSG